jgi:enamine deaminase RidA (YjgF/YER057c/UK114 family)/biotin carboxylase
MADKKVLLLGWRPESLAALRGLGADVTCVLTAADDEKRTGLLDDAHTVPVQDPADTGSVLAGLMRYGISVADFDVICAPGENPLVNAAVLADGRGGATPADALLLRDKDLQKRYIREAGIPVADSRSVAHARELNTFPQPRGVLKPLDGTGTVGVRAWHSEEERIGLARRLADEGANGPWLAEQWVDGRELHVDGVVRGGEVRFLSIGRYLQNVLAIRAGGIVATHVLHPDKYDDLHVRARDVAQRAAKSLAHQDGVFHMEVFEQEDQLVFGEYAGRIPGGEIASMILLQHGVDLDEEWARAVLGLESAAAPSVARACIGFVSLFTPGGILGSCPGEDELTQHEGVRRVSMRARLGEVRPDPADASNAPAAMAVVEGQDEQQVVERMRRLAEWFPAQSVVRPETGSKESTAGKQSELTRLSAPAGVAPSSGYTHVVTGPGRLAAVAGQMAFDAAGELVGANDPVAQARQVFTNMDRCLAAAGATFDDIIKLTYYVTDIAFVPEILAVRDEFIDTRRPPASTVVQVAALYRPDLLLEVDAFAMLAAE